MDTTAITWTRLGQSNEFIATLDGGDRYHVHGIMFQRGGAVPLNDCAELTRVEVDALVLATRAEWRRVYAQEEIYAAERRVAGNPLPRGCCKRCGTYCDGDCQAD